MQRRLIYKQMRLTRLYLCHRTLHQEKPLFTSYLLHQSRHIRHTTFRMHLTFLYLLLHIVSANVPMHQHPFIPKLMSLRYSFPVTPFYNMKTDFSHMDVTNALDAFNARSIQGLMLEILTAIQDGVRKETFERTAGLIMAISFVSTISLCSNVIECFQSNSSWGTVQ